MIDTPPRRVCVRMTSAIRASASSARPALNVSEPSRARTPLHRSSLCLLGFGLRANQQMRRDTAVNRNAVSATKSSGLPSLIRRTAAESSSRSAGSRRRPAETRAAGRRTCSRREYEQVHEDDVDLIDPSRTGS